ncbi:signal peptide peptidase SppA [Halopseudomonas phragmitis]|uniref:S49 family peptidase n=2 Tax=Pseudomonadaceae TaxID=135621 RepID=A0A1V0BAK0_9GAMM|nr:MULTISPECIES: signal peptide peptidase SppA [Pseudomonadaceae]AQZ96824.1 S49 family peptidase [Halopseudomonas phragmitis]PAU87256.1 signal peptide peptidase SppA [Pseudomonas sp. WN033]RHW22721.1 signal peptide peptidase SppA [Pseudomonas jilinensis]
MVTRDEADKAKEDKKAWELLEKAVLASVQEQRRARRWGIVFKTLTFVYLFGVALLFSPMIGVEGRKALNVPHTAVIEVRGMIADRQEASADNLVTSLRRAFEDENTRGIVLRINSPGGSPVQAGYVYDEIKRLRALNPAVPVYAVITDLGASGAYYIAAAADAIYADKASLVGSIGVTAAGFGFVEALDKLGIERRSYTAGEHKSFLDPFQPEKPEERQFWQGVLQTTHQQFIEQVKAGRGERLKEHPDLFSGLVWSGEQALELGLVDGLASTSSVARDVVGVEKIEDFTYRESPFERFTKRLGTSIGNALATQLGLSGPVLR